MVWKTGQSLDELQTSQVELVLLLQFHFHSDSMLEPAGISQVLKHWFGVVTTSIEAKFIEYDYLIIFLISHAFNLIL